MNYCLKGPQDQIVGFRLETEDLGHEIYDILDWADEHFSSHRVEQTDDCVYVCSEAARETLDSSEIRAEPVSIKTDGPGGESGRGPGGSSGGLGGGPSGGGGPGGSGGDGSDGNVPVGAGGGGAVAETAGQ
jgi:hypothetical protein